MKKYNSVFTLAFEAEHDKKDASDLTYTDLRNALQDRLDRMDNTRLSDMVDDDIFRAPDDSNCKLPFSYGDVYWSIDYSDDGRPMVNVSVWDDVSAEEYTDGDMVYGSSYQAMIKYIEMYIHEEFPSVRDPYKGAEWTLDWMSNNGFRMPMHVGDRVFLKDIGLGITEWLNR